MNCLLRLAWLSFPYSFLCWFVFSFGLSRFICDRSLWSIIDRTFGSNLLNAWLQTHLRDINRSLPLIYFEFRVNTLHFITISGWFIVFINFDRFTFKPESILQLFLTFLSFFDGKRVRKVCVTLIIPFLSIFSNQLINLFFLDLSFPLSVLKIYDFELGLVFNFFRFV